MTAGPLDRAAPGDAAGPVRGCRVGVVGLGYAGLPQAVAFAAAGHPVIGVDVDPGVVAAVQARHSLVETVTDEQLRSVAGTLYATTDAAALADCSAVLICVPTPLGADDQPDLNALLAASSAVADQLCAGQLVVVESTVYPGVTENVVRPILEKTGLVAGVDVNLAFAPERVDPGNPVFTVANTAKVVGGLTAVCAHRTAELYSAVVPAVHVTRRLRAAEAAKVLENAYRQVNIALVNEFARFCAATGIDVTDVIDAASTKPFGFQAFRPGVGVGGHCVPVDSTYLATTAREHGVPLHLVETAAGINGDVPRWIAAQCLRLLAAAGVPAAGADTLVLGVTYKPDVADVRNTPVAPLVAELLSAGCDVRVHDPLVPALAVGTRRLAVVADLRAAVRAADLVVLAQPHRQYGPDLLRQARLLYRADRRSLPDEG